MRICLIGPSYPFRGGVAHHTTLLYRNLSRRHDVSFYAFRRQYPKWLFPGESDQDNSSEPLREEGVECVLDSLNPWTWWQVARRIIKDKPDLLIIPWWTSFWAPQFYVITSLVARITTILFICHNLVDHEAHFFSYRCARAVLKRGDRFFVHCEGDKIKLARTVPSETIMRVLHPIYDFFTSTRLSRKNARAHLRLSGNVILFFGFIRPYKGLDILLDAMPLILAQTSVTLLVVGEFWEGREDCLRRIEEYGIGRNVKIVEGYIPNEEVGQYFTAADLVTLPYVEGTASGIVQIAYGFNKPVVATKVGSLPDVVDDGKSGFLVNPRNPGEFAEAVVKFFVAEKGEEFATHIERIRGRFSWQRIVEEIEAQVDCERGKCSVARQEIGS